MFLSYFSANVHCGDIVGWSGGLEGKEFEGRLDGDAFLVAPGGGIDQVLSAMRRFPLAAAHSASKCLLGTGESGSDSGSKSEDS